MKSFFILVAGAAVAVAQFGDLPSCGQVCMTNMNNIAVNQFNCTQGDVLCYCQKINYGYGVRDCANEACSSPADAAAVIAYGTNYCAGAVSSAAPSTPSAPGYSVLSSAAGNGASGTGPSATGSAGNETGTGGAGMATPVSTVSGTATLTSGSSVITTTGAVSTIFSTPTGSMASSLSSVVSNVSSSLSSEASGAASSASATGSAIESSITGTASASGTSTGGAAPMATGAPLLGAGAMAILLAVL